jgi:imidazolonepropionase
MHKSESSIEHSALTVDLLVHNASQLLTLASPGGPKRGAAMSELGIIPDGAVAIRGQEIVAVAPSSELRRQVQAGHSLDVEGRVVLPGFVDPHTHLVWAGDRAGEFEMRLAGATYMEIMAAGGGIMNTVRHTRAAGLDELVAQTEPRLRRMLAHGTTTVEIKSGYGLDTGAEIKQLQAIRRLQVAFPGTLVPTFLGAHAVPAEFKGRADAYVDLLVDEMLPAVHASFKFRVSSFEFSLPNLAVPTLPTPGAPLFCDVFCEEGAFTLEQSRRILEAAKALGFGLKIHVDEFKPLGGTRLAVELGATSADHLVCTPPAEIELLSGSATIAVGLPGTPFGLGHHEYTPARALIEAGGALALATDCNPGTCWCESMQLVLALACRYMKMTPAEAISAATINAAYAVGLSHRVGSLEPGKRADLAILDAPSYTHLGYRFGTNLVHSVIAGGRMV